MHSTRKNSFRALLIVAMLAGTAACGTPHGKPVRVIIPRGSTFTEATDSLARGQIVKWPTGFRILARIRGKDRNIKPGTYLLKPGTSWGEVLSALNGGLGLVNSVTVPEGFQLSQIVPLLVRRLSLPVDSVEAAVRDTALLSRLDIPTKTLEGYLFPDTYAFPDGTKAREAVGEMVKRFEREWKPEWDARLVDLAMNRNDIITLASIIEKEAKLPEERPVISAVYHNRLKKQMLLQADPTIQYALPAHTQRVLYRDLEVKSPYNTYMYAGLPPGPIASPGGPSIVAALFPANVEYLYFVAFPDGHHVFRTTLAEHEAAKKASQSAAAAKPKPKPRGK
jgi:UPF0755 protein